MKENRTKKIFGDEIHQMRSEGMSSSVIAERFSARLSISQSDATRIVNAVLFEFPPRAERIANIQLVFGVIGFIVASVVPMTLILLWRNTDMLDGKTGTASGSMSWLLFTLIASTVAMRFGTQTKMNIDPFRDEAIRWAKLRFILPFAAVGSGAVLLIIWSFFAVFG